MTCAFIFTSRRSSARIVPSRSKSTSLPTSWSKRERECFIGHDAEPGRNTRAIGAVRTMCSQTRRTMPSYALPGRHSVPSTMLLRITLRSPCVPTRRMLSARDEIRAPVLFAAEFAKRSNDCASTGSCSTRRTRSGIATSRRNRSSARCAAAGGCRTVFSPLFAMRSKKASASPRRSIGSRLASRRSSAVRSARRTSEPASTSSWMDGFGENRADRHHGCPVRPTGRQSRSRWCCRDQAPRRPAELRQRRPGSLRQVGSETFGSIGG